MNTPILPQTNQSRYVPTVFVGDRQARAEAALSDLARVAVNLAPPCSLRRIARRWAAVLDSELKGGRR